MKHIFYFLFGLILWPIQLVIAIYALGKETSQAIKIGYKKGVSKWIMKQDKK